MIYKSVPVAVESFLVCVGRGLKQSGFVFRVIFTIINKCST